MRQKSIKHLNADTLFVLKRGSFEVKNFWWAIKRGWRAVILNVVTAHFDKEHFSRSSVCSHREIGKRSNREKKIKNWKGRVVGFSDSLKGSSLGGFDINILKTPFVAASRKGARRNGIPRVLSRSKWCAGTAPTSTPTNPTWAINASAF